MMRTVFETSTGLEAHMILNLLEQAGITGRIDGEYLQGGVGELQAMNFIRVLVPEADYAEAREIIRQWDSVQPASDISERQKLPGKGCPGFFLGVIVGAVIVAFLLKGTG